MLCGFWLEYHVVSWFNMKYMWFLSPVLVTELLTSLEFE